MDKQHDAPLDADASGNAMSNRTRIIRFMFRYRRLGLFHGLALDTHAVGKDVGEGPPEKFVEDLEALGPTFIKLGQMLSTRPDMVPPAYASALERMQEDVAPVPFHHIRETVESELGVRIGKAFKSFEETPLGCASLAQVHRATLRDGTKVAVKVQKPRIAQRLRADLDLLANLALAVDRFTDLGGSVRFVEWLTEFRRAVLAELDYVAEAENLERFRGHLHRYRELTVPRPVWDYTRSRILTMELVQGTNVGHVSGMRRTEQSMAPLAKALVRAYLDQVFVHGEIHADPHPGNLRITADGRLAIFDLGMVANVPPRQRDRLMKLLFAAVDGRGEQVADELIGLSTRLPEFDQSRFLREVAQLVSRYAAHAGSMSEGRVVLDLVRISASTGLRTPPELGLLGKTLLNLDAVCQLLSPELNTQALVEDHLEHVMRARLRKSFSSPNIAAEMMEIQSLLREGPRRLSDILSLLADNRLQVRMTGLEESHLMESLQKIANRICAGVVVASLILASSMLMDADGGIRLWGYPAIALVLFLVAAALGLGIIGSALIGDRRAPRREERPPQ
ncbi:ABC1 kinase family protein [Marilutibacter alkalisoli]|uniref:AarF/ABC1/UbiB kinase family protein n=1 Tax=Marilutibacter alkalisoli TaxID=2591633 RepID=A0A514BQP4_9GAMM|nr:AarF/UbiB family protein [Lysobacter alkalisoli]QDH69625.1 AarF/ABC1/UbiB kinase family protein [Lysobacter alkalisoli]